MPNHCIRWNLIVACCCSKSIFVIERVVFLSLDTTSGWMGGSPHAQYQSAKKTMCSRHSWPFLPKWFGHGQSGVEAGFVIQISSMYNGDWPTKWLGCWLSKEPHQQTRHSRMTRRLGLENAAVLDRTRLRVAFVQAGLTTSAFHSFHLPKCFGLAPDCRWGKATDKGRDDVPPAVRFQQ